MQAVIVLPPLEGPEGHDEGYRRLLRPVSGVGLLTRIVATAARAGVDSVLLVHSEGTPIDRLQAQLSPDLFRGVAVRTIATDAPFDPTDTACWRALQDHLEDVVLWLPFNWVTVKKVLGTLMLAAHEAGSGFRFEQPGGPEGPPLDDPGSRPRGVVGPAASPVVIRRDQLLAAGAPSVHEYLAGLPSMPVPAPGGVSVDSPHSCRQAERLLVRGSGKPTDGLFSNFNRRLCRPTVRVLLKTPVSANAITVAGLLISVLSGYLYSLGTWAGFALGGLVYFIAVEFDEIDGMVARTKFQESAFGCWLETVADYASYIFLFVGMTAGLYRGGGSFWLVVGGLTLGGAVVSFVVVSRQRRMATADGQPQEYLSRLQKTLEDDSQNIVSRFSRVMHIVTKKGVMCHGILWLSLVPGGTQFLLLVAALTANIAWTVTLYTNRLFRTPHDAAREGAPEASSELLLRDEMGGR